MLKFLAISAVLILAIGVKAQSPAYGQCGGQGWAGPTTCVSGYTCTFSNQWYSQCLPGSSTPPSPPPTTTTTRTGGGGTPPPPTSTTSSGPAPTGSQIRTVVDPVYHYYLQNNGGKPRLGPEGSSGHFTIGSTISLNNGDGSKVYLNVGNNTASYKPLSFDTTAVTTNWGLEGDTIIIKTPRQLNFIACQANGTTYYDVYLQQGNDTPSGGRCTMVTMHLPCLC
ncbi:hypothetical protein BDN72DRAFT_885876 [Pluteus cervinus]|uniref:Uncharacterized protein n=1 Tax=Pluteus cervinus TaxID=181527 RepID=A0ACD3BC75_9AGAR|nr:hypothetical protein BDN72DRAFT_885876 [Pluteus cervinus]